jgi:hypothetical protein
MLVEIFQTIQILMTSFMHDQEYLETNAKLSNKIDLPIRRKERK